LEEDIGVELGSYHDSSQEICESLKQYAKLRGVSDYRIKRILAKFIEEGWLRFPDGKEIERTPENNRIGWRCERAIDVLARYNDPEFFELLRKVSRQSNNRRLRDSAVSAICRAGGKDVLDYARETVNDATAQAHGFERHVVYESLGELLKRPEEAQKKSLDLTSVRAFLESQMLEEQNRQGSYSSFIQRKLQKVDEFLSRTPTPTPIPPPPKE